MIKETDTEEKKMGLLKSRVSTAVERKTKNISDEVNSILMAEPFLMTFVHLLRHYETLPEDNEIIACTNGEIVEYGPKYGQLTLPERTYICVHEIGHGTFLHPQRAIIWMMYNGFLFPALWNYAADVVINESIEASPMMRNGLFRSPKLFPPCRLKTTIHDTIAEVAAVTGESPPSDYDPKITRDLRVEVLYQWLVWALFAMRRHRGQDPMTGNPMQRSPGEGQSQGQGQGRPSQQQDDNGRKRQSPPENATDDGGDEEGEKPPVETAVERMEKEDAWDLREQLEDVQRQMREGTSPEDIVKRMEKQVEEARGRIEEVVQGMKVAGVGHGSMLLSLSKDLPAPTVPWDRLIRKLVDGALGINMQKSHTRPGNATLCAMAMGNRNLPVSYGITIYSPRPRIMIGMDVSGSMHDEIRRCFAETWSMAQMKNAEIDLATWDDGVQDIISIKSKADFDRILTNGIRGGGGSSLVTEVFDIAQRMGHQLIVIMTDGYINICLPQPPRIPVIWAITPGGTSTALEEYGTVVKMAPEPRIALNTLISPDMAANSNIPAI